MSEKPKSIFTLSALAGERKLPEIIAVTSGKGGVGKTFFSVNLSILLRQYKKRVLLIDADLHLGNVDLFLGLRPKYNISDLLQKEIELRDVILRGPGDIDILPAGSAVGQMIGEEETILKRVHSVFSKLEPEYDQIVVDTGAGISPNVMSFVLGADKVVVVVTPDPASIADAYGMIKVISQAHPLKAILLITNMVNSEDEGKSLFNKMNLMVRRFLQLEIGFGGAILKDNLISKSIKHQHPIFLQYASSVPANQIKLATRKLLGMPVTAMQAESRGGYFGRVLSNRNLSL